jgi:predicted CoA-binding protein
MKYIIYIHFAKSDVRVLGKLCVINLKKIIQTFIDCVHVFRHANYVVHSLAS